MENLILVTETADGEEKLFKELKKLLKDNVIEEFNFFKEKDTVIDRVVDFLHLHQLDEELMKQIRIYNFEYFSNEREVIIFYRDKILSIQPYKNIERDLLKKFIEDNFVDVYAVILIEKHGKKEGSRWIRGPYLKAFLYIEKL